MLKVKQFAFNPFGVSTFVVYDPETAEAIVVDPGMASETEREKFNNFVKQNCLSVTQIVNTHLHIDHCVANNFVKKTYGVPVLANEADAFLGQAAPQQAAGFGVRFDDEVKPVTIDRNLSDGDRIKIGNQYLDVLQVPGHSPGSVCLYYPQGGWVIAGDTLFQGSMGRTDLPGGDFRTLVDAIRRKLLTLPDDTMVLPGHGPATTIGAEKSAFRFFS